MRKRGKKIDVIVVREGAQVHSVDLRFDKEHGDFIAELGSEEFTGKNLAELKTKLQEKAKELVRYVFKWFIVVKYSVEYTNPGASNSWSSSSSFDEIDFDRHVVSGLDFRFNVVERSQALETGEMYQDKRYYQVLQRDVEENADGVLEVDKTEPHKPHRLLGEEALDGDGNELFVEFTPERYAKLKAIRQALTELARRLNEVLGKNASTVAKVLDSMPAQPLMLAAPQPQEEDSPGRARRRS